MKRLLILLTGMPGSGKSIVVEVARDIGIPVYNMGDVVREEVIKRHGYITPELMVKTSLDLRREQGDDIVARRTLEKIPLGEDIVLIDGVRSLVEVEFFRRHGEVVVVAIHASPKTRYKRLLERKRPGDPSNIVEFNERDLAEINVGIGAVIALADYMIVNEGSIDETKSHVLSLLVKLVKSRGDSG